MRVNIEEKSYDGKRKILKNIKLDIPEHQTTLIIGTSGAGKSTLIKCLIRQTKFKGTIIDEEYDHKVMLEKIAYIPQHPALNKNETVEESIYWTARLNFLRQSKANLLEKTKKCINDAGLNYVCKQPVKALSGGQMQRVAIARALANEPAIILADEPTGNLDSETGKKIFNLLHSLTRSQNVTILAVTHDLDIAGRTDRTFTLKDGKMTA